MGLITSFSRVIALITYIDKNHLILNYLKDVLKVYRNDVCDIVRIDVH